MHSISFPQGQFLEDAQIRAIAVEQGRIVITKDNDFPDRFFLEGAPPKILHLEIGNIKNNDLVDLLDLFLPTIVSLFESGAEMVKMGRDTLISY
ncbi:DUF5615 family PIN-like protein [Larkinella soli]|uniref:DUF5615 family PIN-like protein n=1 Tax=Larkinella soli TaxID=1770527 RepID=UPI00286DAE74|nr:DUF5615 family PIN-like protein [Larkinella soli]